MPGEGFGVGREWGVRSDEGTMSESQMNESVTNAMRFSRKENTSMVPCLHMLHHCSLSISVLGVGRWAEGMALRQFVLRGA